MKKNKKIANRFNVTDRKFKRSLIALAVISLSNQSFAQDPIEEEAENTEVIEVKGIRGALANAAELKREANTFVDSITATDTSALPDLSVAEALSRIPGVTVTRFTSGGSNGDFPSPEGSGNLIRGLGFARSEFNGRDAFTANGGRALDWSAIPPELVGGVDVYKNHSADLIEGGISGTVNLRTLEPFDREGPVAIVSIDTTYTDLREAWSPSFSTVLGNRWDTSKGEFGLLGSVSTSELQSDIHGFQTGAPTPRTDIDPNGVATVPGFQLRTNEVDRERDSYYISGQWRSPDNDIEATFKYIRVENEITSSEQTTEWFPDFASSGRVEISDLVVKPFTSDGIARCNGNNEPESGDCDVLIPVSGGLMEEGLVTDNGDSWYGAYGLQVSNLGIGKREESTTDDMSFNIKWRPSDQWLLKFDAHRTTAEASYNELWAGSNTFLSVFTRPDLDNPRLEFSVDPRLNIGEGQIFDVGTNQVPYAVPTSTDDPGGYFIPFVADSFRDGTGELFAIRGDAEYEFENEGWFDSIKFGARYSEREQINKEAGLNWKAGSQPWGGGIARLNALDSEVHEVVDFSDFFRGGVVQGDNQSFVYVNSDLLANPTQFYDFYINEPDLARSEWSPFTTGDTKIVNGEEVITLRRSIDGNYTNIYQDDEISDIVEEAINLYVRLDFTHDFDNDMWLDGNFGVRYVKTDLISNGFLGYDEFGLDRSNIELEPDYPQDAEDRDHVRDFLPETAEFLDNGLDETRVVKVSDKHLLPSFNVKLNLNEDMLIRFAVSEAVTRPNVQDLRASQSISAGTSRIDFEPLQEDDPRSGIPRGVQDISLQRININGGNPNLLATTAVNWDISFEWYFEEGGQFTAALFSKKLKNIITNGSDVRDSVTYDGKAVNLQYNGPVNQADAELTGIEFSYHKFFDDLPGVFSNLGIQANYTYIDASATPPPAFKDDDGDGQPDPGTFANTFRFGLDNLLGQSEHTANLVGIYEDDEFEARLAYNWRSEYLNSYRDFVTGNPIFQDKSGFLDFSMRYDFTDNVQIAMQVANVLDTKSKSFTQIDQAGQTAQRSSFLNDRRLKFAVRYQF